MEQKSTTHKFLVLLIAIIILLVLIAVVTFILLNNSNKNTGLADPSAVYCKEQGYQYKIKTSVNGGQYGVCVFNNGKECDSWKYYDHTCSPDTA